MVQQEHDGIQQETFINIRKLAALDIALHGAKLILAEFAFAVAFGAFIGPFNLFVFFRKPGHPLAVAIAGFFFTWIAVNYVPMLLYAISIARRKSAEREVALELERKSYYVRKYTYQSLLLLLPLVVPLLAVFQEVQKRSSLRSRA